ncbi:META domain-containing protein [Litorilituus lipolyticus]|uniref:META domain-containing protein n=1 Tax=Litorilituus lipolyticus TaxID=2491017 RepID=A0A502L0T8_9GAMM|nr:META domain-containing protein [Litorilituus lipolyticus]TPH16399.1 META domain-containing protein [Litorilituus lipolyticus]
MKLCKVFITSILAIVMLSNCSANQSEKSPPIEHQKALIGQWQVITIKNQNVIAQHSATLMFADDNTLMGTTGCNNFRTSFTQENSKLTITMAATTRKMCPGKLMAQESSFLQELPNIAHFKLNEHQLTLFNREGNTVITAKKIYL